MKNFCIVFFALFFFFGCTSPNNPTAISSSRKSLNLDSLKNVLKQTDLAFSQLSSHVGANKSFIAYADNNVTLLRANSMPIVGIDSFTANVNSGPDTSYILTWQPLFADIASSGELGYTYGTYQLKEKKSGDIREGTYCTIWKRDDSGNWKYVLDTGNPGLKPPKK